MSRGPSISCTAVLAVLGTLMGACSPDKVAQVPADMTKAAAETGPVLSFPGAFGWSPATDVAPRLRVPQGPGPVVNTGIVPGHAVKLQQTVQLALAQSPDIGRAVAEIYRSRGDVMSAEAAWLPKATYVSTIGTDPGSPASVIAAYGRQRVSAGVELNQLVYDFGRADGQIAASHAVREQRDAELHDAEERVAMTASEAHLELVRAQNMLGATDHYLTALVNLRTAITLRAKSGAADQADVLVADSRVQSARGERIRSQTRFASAQSKLYQLTGVRLTRAADPGTALQALTRAIKSAPGGTSAGVVAAEFAAAAARGRLKAAEAAVYPAIGIKASETFPIADKSITATALLGFSVQGDLFSGGANEGRIKAATADALSAERSIALARLNSQTEIEGASAEVSGAAQRAVAYGRQLATVRQAREIALSEYSIGKRTLTEVLNMEQEIFRAESDRINADSDGQVAIIRAAATSGVLVQSLLRLQGRS